MGEPRPVGALIALPAHNEQDLIGDCLASVIRAVELAQRRGRVDQATVAVALHRCDDDTPDRVRSALSGRGGMAMVVMTEMRPMAVGAVRTKLIEYARTTAGPADGWIFSTDADTVVPPDWVTGTLDRAAEQGSDLVLGLADLNDWDVDAATRRTYEHIIESGLDATGHRHAYAANLAIRQSAFWQVGGFPAVRHGEEHGLAAACRAAGLRVTSTLHPRVQTSARMPGRADHGLGALLAQLASPGTKTPADG